MKAWLSRRLRRAMASVVGPLIFHENVDSDGRVLRPRPAIGRVNQWLMETGRVPPWIMTREECLAFWRTRSNNSPGGNRPIDYVQKPIAIAEYLYEFWRDRVQTDFVILEVGCNAGTNLEVLRRLGYRRLAGLEISTEAVLEMQRVYPELCWGASVHVDSAEEGLRKLAAGSFDVVFTIAAAMHIHPSSNGVFSEIVRVARRYVCTIELESANCGYVFARNYQRVFSRLGCRQIKSETIVPDVSPALDRPYWGYVSRLFEVRPSPVRSV